MPTRILLAERLRARPTGRCWRGDLLATLTRLSRERRPFYAEADIHMQVRRPRAEASRRRSPLCSS
jgi:hypothetical protein